MPPSTFVLAQDHELDVAEMKRILKPDGRTFLNAARGRIGYVDDAEWEQIMGGFRVEPSPTSRVRRG